MNIILDNMPNLISWLIIAISSGSIVLLTVPLLIKAAHKINFLDIPYTQNRKNHIIAIPPVGGLAISFSVLSTLLIFCDITPFLRAYLVGTIIISFIGFLDDLRELSPILKFLGQIAAAILVLSLDDIRLVTFGDLFGLGDIMFQWGAYPLTIFSIVGVMNAINLIDGLDGLAGGIAFLCLGGIAMISFMANSNDITGISFCLLAAVAAFLRFNWNPAKIFMGDTGSLFLGLSIVLLLIKMTNHPTTTNVPPVLALWLIIVPLFDTITVMLRRVGKGRSPFAPDRSHIHHILLRWGFTQRQVVSILLSMSSAGVLLAFTSQIYGWPESCIFIIFLVCFSFYFYMSFHLPYIYRKTQKFRRRVGSFK